MRRPRSMPPARQPIAGADAKALCRAIRAPRTPRARVASRALANCRRALADIVARRRRGADDGRGQHRRRRARAAAQAHRCDHRERRPRMSRPFRVVHPRRLRPRRGADGRHLVGARRFARLRPQRAGGAAGARRRRRRGSTASRRWWPSSREPPAAAHRPRVQHPPRQPRRRRGRRRAGPAAKRSACHTPGPACSAPRSRWTRSAPSRCGSPVGLPTPRYVRLGAATTSSRPRTRSGCR